MIAGINIDIPIFSANMRRKAFKNAKINLETKKLTQKQIQKSILTALNTAYNNYVSSLENIQLLEENLKTIEKTAEISRELYDSGQLSNLEYRESQVLLDQAEINYSSKLSATKIQEYLLYQDNNYKRIKYVTIKIRKNKYRVNKIIWLRQFSKNKGLAGVFGLNLLTKLQIQ